MENHVAHQREKYTLAHTHNPEREGSYTATMTNPTISSLKDSSSPSSSDFPPTTPTPTPPPPHDEITKSFQPAIINWEHIDKTRFYTLAPIAGIMTRVVLYPTTLVKTRLQVQKHVSWLKRAHISYPLCG